MPNPNEAWRKVWHRYIVDSEAITHEEVIAEYPNGGKDIVIVVDIPERGHWETRLDTGEIIDFNGTIPEDAPHDIIFEDFEYRPQF